MLSPVGPDKIGDVAAAALRIECSPAAVAYTGALRNSSFAHDLIEGTLELEWAVTRMVSDDPAKGLGRAAPETLVFQELKRTLVDLGTDLELVSPYFVPTAVGVAWFAALVERGVEIKVLTNSLEATDVAFVHAGYAKRRKPLLNAGITLYELRRAMTTGPGPEKPAGSIGSSGSSLHAKTFSADRARVFIGSFNFDPRSATLNTEMGFIIESPALAGQIDATFRSRVPMDAYEVRLAEGGQLFWVEPREGESLRHDREPGTGVWRRAWVSFLSALPIEWLL